MKQKNERNQHGSLCAGEEEIYPSTESSIKTDIHHPPGTGNFQNRHYLDQENVAILNLSAIMYQNQHERIHYIIFSQTPLLK